MQETHLTAICCISLHYGLASDTKCKKKKKREERRKKRKKYVICTLVVCESKWEKYFLPVVFSATVMH